MNKEELIAFEKEIIPLWDAGKIPYPIHFCGGNEDALIEIFSKIKPGDYIFSTHRAHYHYLLAGGSKEKLKEMIMTGYSMRIIDKELNFISSSIVSGATAIATGVALAIKRKGDNKHVWCFIGDGAEDTGHFYEAVRYADGHDLPCTFVIEDNNYSVETPKSARNGSSDINWPTKHVIKYKYEKTYPHVGSGKWVDFGGMKAGGSSF